MGVMGVIQSLLYGSGLRVTDVTDPRSGVVNLTDTRFIVF